jgi:hypothetical protein
MAKRVTIRANPLDTLVPDTMTRQTGKSPAATKTQSAGPASVIAQTTTPESQPGVKNSTVPAPATQVAQAPSSADLFSRIQSLEEQNEYMRWLVGGAIVLALLL